MKQFSKNFIALTSADLLRRLFGFFTIAYLARILGTETFGALNIAYAVLAYGLVLSSGGLTTVGIRSLAQGAADDTAGQIPAERFVLTCVFLVLIISITYCFVADIQTKTLIILFAFVLLPQALSLEWYFMGKESMSIVGLTRTLSAFVSMVTAFLFIRTPEDAWLLAPGTFAGEGLASLVLWWKYRQQTHKIPFRFSFTLKLFRSSLALTLGVVLATVVINFPPLALGLFRSSDEVGIYSAASKLVFFLLLGDRLLSSLLLPASSRKVSLSHDHLLRMASDALRWTFLLALPLVVGGMIVAHPLIAIVFGESYWRAASVLQIFLWYFFITLFHTIFTSLLLALHQEKAYSTVMVLTALLYACFVSLGSLFWGAGGAAGGVVLAEGISLFLLWNKTRISLHIPFPNTFLRSVFATISMAIVLWLVSSFPFAFQILTGIVVYFVVAFLVGAVRWSDVKELLEKFV